MTTTLRFWQRPATVESTAEIDWEAVYMAEMPRIFNYFWYRMGDATIAEDLTATTFEKAWRARARYRSKRAAFSTWLYAIARNTCLWHRGQNPILTPYTSPILDPSEFAQLEGNASSRHFVYM